MRGRPAWPMPTRSRREIGDDDTRPPVESSARGASFDEVLDDTGAEAAGHTTALLAQLQAGVENEVLETATRTMPAAGFLERKWQAPYAGVTVINPSAAALTVQEGAATSTTAQGDGPGSFPVPAGSMVTMPLTGRALTIYGAAGTRFGYCVLTRRPPPSGSLGPAAAGATATTPPVYTAPLSGELIGVIAATQLPSVACKLVRFKASSTNTGKVYLGVTSGVTAAAGSTSTTAGLQLSAGDDTGWIPVDNLNRFWRICSDITSHLTYLALA